MNNVQSYWLNYCYHGNPIQIELLLDPACTYSVTMETEGFRTAANLIRYHYHLIGGALLFVLLGACDKLVRGQRPTLLLSVSTI